MTNKPEAEAAELVSVVPCATGVLISSGQRHSEAMGLELAQRASWVNVDNPNRRGF